MGDDCEVRSEVRISWFYYDTDVEVDTLLNTCLNPKGQRERALQATMRQVRDRLKLKKGVSKLALEEQQKSEASQKIVDEVDPVAALDEELREAEEELAESSHSEKASEPDRELPPSNLVERHILFKTDKWDQSFQTAVWFGKKVPAKRRVGARLARQASNGGEGEEVQGPELVSMAHARKLLLNTETFYTDSSTQFSREWAKPEVREAWQQEVGEAADCVPLSALLTKLDDGMSLPNMLAKEGPQRGGSQYFRLMHFKFWPAQDLRRAWREYLGEPLKVGDEESKEVVKVEEMLAAGHPKAGNHNALFILLKILERITEQFVMREVEKQEKKERQAALQAVGGQQAVKMAEQKLPASRRVQPASAASVLSRDQRKAASYAKYFESSNEEEYGDEEEEEEEEEDGQEAGSQPADQEMKPAEVKSSVASQSNEEDDSD